MIAPYETPYVDGIYFRTNTGEKEYMDQMEAHARKALAKVATYARDAEVACDSEAVVDSRPWQGIINSASKLKCDTIVMSSHGCGGMADVVMGSQTSRVLSHAKVPVLVCR